MPARKAHYVEVTLSSVSNDTLNSETIHREFADTPEELVNKNFSFADGVVTGLMNAARALAKAGGLLK